MTTTTATAKNVPALSVTIEGSVLRITASNGRVLSLNADTLHPQIQIDSMLHGLKQKLIDAGAIGRDPVTGRSATVADKFNAVYEIYERITGDNPTWNKVRDAGMSAGQGLLVRALMQISGKSKKEIDVYLEARSKEERAALRKNEKVAAAILELQLANVDSSIDTDELLDGLMD